MLDAYLDEAVEQAVQSHMGGEGGVGTGGGGGGGAGAGAGGGGEAGAFYYCIFNCLEQLQLQDNLRTTYLSVTISIYNLQDA